MKSSKRRRIQGVCLINVLKNVVLNFCSSHFLRIMSYIFQKPSADLEFFYRACADAKTVSQMVLKPKIWPIYEIGEIRTRKWWLW